MFKFAALSTVFSLAVAASSNYLVVFGNSLSDIGNIDNVTYAVPWYNGRFSNGPVWNEYLAHTNNLTLINYAIGGAASNNTFVYDISGQNVTIPSAIDQIVLFNQTFGGKFSEDSIKNDIAVVEIGGNDFLYSASELATNSTDLNTFTDDLVEYIMNGVRMLYDMGYKKILVTDISDLGVTPSILALSQTASENVGDYVTAANDKLSIAVASYLKMYESDVDYIRVVDLYGFVKIVSEPTVSSALNITVTNAPCYVTLNGTLVSSCSNSDEYLFMDTIHPSTKVHALTAAVISEIISNSNFTLSQSVLLDLIDSYDIKDVSSNYNWLYKNYTNKTDLIITEYTIKEATANAKDLIQAQSSNGTSSNDNTSSSSSSLPISSSTLSKPSSSSKLYIMSVLSIFIPFLVMII
ncbi:Thermolabile hemolysin [Smittium mucronatum]|uniref:Thermolabile hemolysin n=1 Tax=Smittium mucronatum TaxID=133383 RepID=A0A1R0H8C4_9FUNG|nr:Thermolabile hemolysin [Smittium mucronatum]